MRRVLSALVLVVALVSAAYGGEGFEGESSGATSTVASMADEPAQSTTTTTEPPIQVHTATGVLGEYLSDGEGNALYVFLPDEAGPSICLDDCAAAWPPLVGGAAATEGVDASLLGIVQRDDGADQITYNGWPLYLFSGDSGVGDINGQGVNDTWFVIDPAGVVVEDAADAPAPGYYDY